MPPASRSDTCPAAQQDRGTQELTAIHRRRPVLNRRVGLLIIDIATHVYPKPVYERVKRIAPTFGSMGARIDNNRQLYDFDERFRLMDEAGEYVQIISLSSPPIEEFMTPEQGNEIARVANDSMA